jgi:hypothetical protein
MSKRKRTTDWPEGFEIYIRGRRFTDIEELLLWDCACMVECWEEALARWNQGQGRGQPAEMRSGEWKNVRVIADEISRERWGAPLRMHAIRWGCRLAKRLEGHYLIGKTNN